MKFAAILKLAWHTLWQNKVRSILTVIIIAVVSFVTVSLFGFVFSLADSSNANLDALIKENGVTISINFMQTNGNYSSQMPISENDVDKISIIMNEYDDTFTSVSMLSFGQGETAIWNIRAELVPIESESYGMAYVNRVNGLKGALEGGSYENRGVIDVYTSLDTPLLIYNIVFWVIFGTALIISLIITLLSINSVSNTVRISAEQNRKFFGVMKALGMRSSSVNAILMTQVFILLLIGVTLATGAAFGMLGVINMLLSTLLGVMFYSVSEVIVLAGISPLVPLIALTIFALFIVLFTRTSLHSVSKMDVITVINEVS